MDAAADAGALDAALSEPVPRITTPPNPLIDLYVGVRNKEGEWQKTAIVRELTGADEEALASLEAKNGVVYAEYISFMLRRAVEFIGDIEVIHNPSVIDELIIGDRDKLFMAVIEATYGNIREYQVDCTSCGESNDVFVDTKTFPEKPLKKGVVDTISATLKDGTEVSFRLPNGSDSLAAAKSSKTVAEQNTFLLSRCVVNAPGDANYWAKNLNMGDRSKLIKTLLSAQPGPEIGEVETQCAHCNESFTMMLDWVSLLFG